MHPQTQEAFFDELEKIALGLPSGRTAIGATAGAALGAGLGPVGMLAGGAIGGYVGSKWNKAAQRKKAWESKATQAISYQDTMRNRAGMSAPAQRS